MKRDLYLPLLAVGVLATVSASVTIACNKSSSSTDRSCTVTGQALTAMPIRGGLPAKTLALTFDDGPGFRTEALSKYLKEKGIRAGFFINGKMVTHGTGVLQEIVADGHLLANHTQTHADLTTLTPAQVVAEVAETDALIAPFVPDNRFLFRPPFGFFNDATLAALQGSAMSKYVGPIDWDIGRQMGPGQAADWDCWSAEGTSVPPVIDPKACGDLYLTEIRRQQSGIVLLHDPYFIDDDPMKGGTVDMIEYIIPILQSEGFSFVRIDEVPAIAAQLPPLPKQDSTSPTAAGSPGEGSSGAAGGDTTDPCAALPQAGASK